MIFLSKVLFILFNDEGCRKPICYDRRRMVDYRTAFADARTTSATMLTARVIATRLSNRSEEKPAASSGVNAGMG